MTSSKHVLYIKSLIKKLFNLLSFLYFIFYIFILKYRTKSNMTRGISLSQDLKLLINNPRYSDIEIICEHGIKLYGCRAILAARSEILDGLLYNGMRESFDNKISFPEISSSVMEIVLEFLYTGCY